MCGRFYADSEMINEIMRVVDSFDGSIRDRAGGDVRPSQSAVVIRRSGGSFSGRTAGLTADPNAGQTAGPNAGLTAGPNDGLAADTMRWGFPGRAGKGLLINARAETALQRPTFRESVRHRRCVIPAGYFYEWDAGKNQVTFRQPEQPVIFMAGFYSVFETEERFVILTAQANDSVRPVHDRMPLILERDELKTWICEDGALEQILAKENPMLQSHREYEQQVLPIF